MSLTVLKQYQQLQQLMQNMSTAIQDDNWSALSRLQSQYIELAQHLSSLDMLTIINTLDSQQQINLTACFNETLCQQQQLTQLMREQYNKIGQLIGKTINQRGHIHSYQQVALLF
ncbi:flagellar protein FliT [Frischella sp. Ac48]|uniref:Flagellar protein FliT n=1 Tax=Frischella japonica TaxID=2741544 RepID=A0ABR7QZM7_9GAMM|nr:MULTISPECIES: flagellar protein FliT [Frischella]MBC9131679.1 flagellar protein FliT [Frischella japonica]MBX4134127.1 flagellar protein FliT [Frischella sp. Ac48]